MNLSALMSSNRMDWETPQWLFDKLNSEFSFDVDVCANSSNHKCANYYTEDDDSLTKRWNGNVFCNPPYGRDIKYFVEKAYVEHLINLAEGNDNTIVLLIPARTDTSYWHDFVLGKSEIRFIKGRLKFELEGSAGAQAPFPSAVIVYSKKATTSLVETMLNKE